jgi:hypothetical protein|tara:strand:+ start:238 stop:591 length:354 start_codon:yes stop_codon:yes gene_type:complete
VEYKILTFKTLTGKLEFIDLGEHSYGEWIIYEDNLPKFHIDCFRENSLSDSLIKDLIEKENWTIEKLLDRINQMDNRNLTLGKRPLIEIEASSELKEIKLDSLPIELVKKLRVANKT